MITQTDITVFVKKYNAEKRMNETTAVYIKNASWYEKFQSALTGGGFRSDNIVKIRIPTEDDLKIEKGDRVTKGKLSECPKDALTILSVGDNRKGSKNMWHWAVTAK